MIIKPKNIEEYPKIIGSIKSKFTKLSNIERSINNNRESNIWQRRYWEHTIRDENDLYKHIDYIHYNDWCNFEDKYNIKNMNIE